MNKQIIVVGSKDSGNKNDPSVLAASVGGIVCYWEDLHISIDDRGVMMRFGDKDLLELNPKLVIAVGWYKSGKNSIYRDVAFSLALFLDSHGIPYWNKEMGTQRSTTKLSTLVSLAISGVPVTPTKFSLDNGSIDDEPLPFIAKAVSASRGESNYYVGDEAYRVEIDKDEASFLVQPFLPNDHDLRVICFGGLPSMVLRRSRSENSQSHLNNVSAGGAGEWLDVSSLSDELLTNSKKICKILGRELAGIDFIPDEKSPFGYSCLEVNAIPQLTSGYDVEKKMKALNESIEGYLQ